MPVKNSLLYAAALSEQQIPFELHIYPFGFHGLSTADQLTNENLPDSIRHIHWLEDLKKWLKIMGITQ